MKEALFRLDVIGFGSLNLDEFWEAPRRFLEERDLRPGEEHVKDVGWFLKTYPALRSVGRLKAIDPGGSAANMIAAMRRMGFRTGFYGVTGRRDADKMRLQELGEPEDLHIRLAGTPAGRCLAIIDKDDPGRDRTLLIVPNANDLTGADDMNLRYFESAQWVHLTSFVSSVPLEAQASLVSRLSERTKVSFDPGAVYVSRGFDALEPILRRTEILFVTEQELETLTDFRRVEPAVERVLECGAAVVVVKMGERGIAAFQKGKSFHRPPIRPRVMTDRTGAGDVAAAGFIAGILEGIGVRGSLELAAGAASRSIEGFGRSSYPDRSFFDKVVSPLKTIEMIPRT